MDLNIFFGKRDIKFTITQLDDPRTFMINSAEYLDLLHIQEQFNFHNFTNIVRHVESFLNRDDSPIKSIDDLVGRWEFEKPLVEIDDPALNEYRKVLKAMDDEYLARTRR
ncbi:MAG: hypothetical protein AB7Q04_13460 [Steroidobacteraceae bacterium]